MYLSDTTSNSAFSFIRVMSRHSELLKTTNILPWKHAKLATGLWRWYLLLV